MGANNKLRIGDVSENGQITIIDEDRLCYLVKSVSKGAVGLRNISKALLDEFVVYMRQHPEVPANEVRFKISGQSEIDKYEYGYGATLSAMANMVLGRMKVNHRTAIVSKSATANLRICSLYRSYITAIKSKPFLLLAGISGTGKSRIVRELAKACWEKGSKEYKDPKPKNFEMVQVKPNWHDSSELIGYVSRVSGSPVFVAGDFLKFVAKAWENPEIPYFLCLD